MIVHIVHNEELREVILQELDPLISPFTSNEFTEVAFAAQLQDCSTFMAVYHEALRLSSSSMTLRYVLEDTTIRGLKIKKGGRVIIPYRQVMLDESVYGCSSHRFIHDRFLEAPELLNGLHFKPFGGGVTLCPGRAVAQKEILTFVALALGKFRVRLPQGEPKIAHCMPKMNTQTPCLGIMGPETNEDVLVSVCKPQW
ncbi:cytochrome P450 [Byssothecium circinans]|uniref:Cytochrome P450 n=1 Tax=Byssothecium circinans TaxID=147558 RepID=A0A6A5TDS4_9PLEO|nr:cytochrome P450 [Byssothecium circinans]